MTVIDDGLEMFTNQNMNSIVMYKSLAIIDG